jgi:hypothetical protein
MQIERIRGEHKQEFTRASEDCCLCGFKMDTWQTQYIDDGYDYIEWVCKNDDCGNRENRTLYHNDTKVKPLLIDW